MTYNKTTDKRILQNYLLYNFLIWVFENVSHVIWQNKCLEWIIGTLFTSGWMWPKPPWLFEDFSLLIQRLLLPSVSENQYTLSTQHLPLTRVIIIKGIFHPEMNIWCFSAYPQGIQDVADFVSSVEHKRRFLTQTVAVCQSYNGSQWDPRLWE